MKPFAGFVCGLIAVIGVGAVPPEDLLPAHTLAVATIPDMIRLRAAIAQTPASRLWNDEAMRPFTTKFATGFHQHVLDGVQAGAGAWFREHLDLAQGQMTLAMIAPAAGLKTPGFLVIVDTGKRADALATKLRLLRETLNLRRSPFKLRTLRGVEFLELPAPEGMAGSVLLGRSDTLFIAATREADLDPVLLAQSGGGGKRLAQVGAFARLRDTQFRDALALGWLDASAALELAVRSFHEFPDGPASERVTPDRVVGALGFKGLRAVSLSYKRDGGDLLEVRLDVPAQNRRGLFKAFMPESDDTAPPPFVGTDVLSYLRYRIQGPALWKLLVDTALDIAPQVDSVIKLGESAVQARDPKFRFQESFFDTLGSDFIRIQVAPRGKSLGEQISPPSFFFVESKKPAATLAAVVTLLGVAGLEPKTHEAEGRRIHSYLLPGRPEAARSSLHFTSTGSYVVAATDEVLLEGFLRGEAHASRKPLRDLPGLDAAVSRVGGYRTGWLGISQDRVVARSLFGFLREHPDALESLPIKNGLKFTRLDPKGEGLPLDWVDFKLLPAFERVEKYFTHTVYSVGADEAGISLRVLTPAPSAPKE